MDGVSVQAPPTHLEWETTLSLQQSFKTEFAIVWGSRQWLGSVPEYASRRTLLCRIAQQEEEYQANKRELQKLLDDGWEAAGVAAHQRSVVPGEGIEHEG